MPINYVKYFGWSDYNEMANEFCEYKEDKPSIVGFPTEDEVLLAVVEQESYEASCIIYWKRDGNVYEAECGHCSCYGFSDAQSHGNQFSDGKPITSDYLHLRGTGFYPIKYMTKNKLFLMSWDVLLESF